MRYANAVILDLQELKHARTESTGKLKIQQSEECSGNVDEDHNSLMKKAVVLFLTVCLLGCFRHFQVKRHISEMCWYDTLSEALKSSCGLIFIHLETMDFGPLVFLYCGVSFPLSSS